MIKKSTNGNLFGVMLGQLDFCFEITLHNGRICFKKGWKKFVEGSEIETGDILFLQPDSETFKVRACLVADVEENKISNSKGILNSYYIWITYSVVNYYCFGVNKRS